jgi:hypothetical protein
MYSIKKIVTWENKRLVKMINASEHLLFLLRKLEHRIIQGVSAKTFEPNISVICQRIFMKFKMQIF